MKILGMSFGTRNGNNDAMCKEALMAAQEMGAEIEFIQMQDVNIKPCTGCISCTKAIFSGRGNGCVQKDDLDWLVDKMFESDGIVVAVPIFEKGTTGLFHTLTDRFGPRMDRGNMMVADKIMKEKGGPGLNPRMLMDKPISFISIGGSDWATRVQTDCAMIPMTVMWKVIDNKVFSWSKGILMDDAAIAQCHQVGLNLAKAAQDNLDGKEMAYQGEEGVCPHCHCKEFYIDPENDYAVTCDLCGMVGKLTVNESGKITFVFPEEQLKHAHDTLSGKFFHAGDIKENEGRLAEMQKNNEEFKARKKKYAAFIQGTKPPKAV